MIDQHKLYRLLRGIINAQALVKEPDRMTGDGPNFSYYCELDPTDRATMHRIAAGEAWQTDSADVA